MKKIAGGDRREGSFMGEDNGIMETIESSPWDRTVIGKKEGVRRKGNLLVDTCLRRQRVVKGSNWGKWTKKEVFLASQRGERTCNVLKAFHLERRACPSESPILDEPSVIKIKTIEGKGTKGHN